MVTRNDGGAEFGVASKPRSVAQDGGRDLGSVVPHSAIGVGCSALDPYRRTEYLAWVPSVGATWHGTSTFRHLSLVLDRWQHPSIHPSTDEERATTTATAACNTTRPFDPHHLSLQRSGHHRVLYTYTPALGPFTPRLAHCHAPLSSFRCSTPQRHPLSITFTGRDPHMTASSPRSPRQEATPFVSELEL